MLNFEIIKSKKRKSRFLSGKKILSAVLFFVVTLSIAQKADLNKTLPLDPKIRTGVLPNGIKYFIRYNAKPEKRAELRMALNAGSTAENDDQQGLAHMTEHMAFNGSKNFKKNELVDYLESVGTKFGAHLNAYTSFDETVYMIQVPTDSLHILDKGVQILEEWAHNLSFDSVEIDKERGVVIEEWRLGQGAQERMRRKYWPVLFKDSRYEVRLPIGKKEILEKCSYETLRSFYRDWYRPDLMAIIAVGDFDVDRMEKQIKERFAAIPSKQNPKPLQIWPVPDQKDFRVATVTDKEATFTLIRLNYLHNTIPLVTANDYRNMLIRDLYNSMINQRLSELQKQADPPFLFAQTNYTGMVRNKDSYSSFAAVKQDGIERGVTVLVTENERIKRFGFTAGELERQKKEMMRGIEKQFNERDKSESRNFAQEYVSYFLENEAAPGIEMEFDLYKQFVPGISLEEVNALAKDFITDGQNATLIVMGPDKEGVVMPTEEKLKGTFNDARKADIKAYVDKVVDKPLLAQKPAAGKVTEEKRIAEYDITDWKLSNGLRVLLKPTDFKNDEIQFTAYKFGGTSLYDDADYQSADFSNAIVSESGIGDFDLTSLEKVLTGKIADVSPSIDDLMQSMSGSCSPQDLETMMQLIYLYHTAPRKDETAFQSLLEQQKGFLQNRTSSPEAAYRDTVSYYMSGYNFRSRPMTVEMLKDVNLDKSLDIYKKRFGDANGWVYTFVGNFKPEQLKPLVEMYLGGMPSTSTAETYRDLKIETPKGKAVKTVRKGVEPKAAVSLKWNGPFEFNRNNRNEMNALSKLLSIKLRENLREDKGGVYGVGATPRMSKYPKGTYEFNIGFGCAPENVEKLIAASLDEINDIKANGCNDKNLTKIKETFLRERESYLKENFFWLGAISQSAMNNESILELKDYTAWVNSLKSDDFKRLANKYFDMNEYKRFVLLPEK